MNGENIKAQPQAPQSSMGIYFFLFFILLMILFIPSLRDGLGYAAGIVFNPLFAFNYIYPLYTILATGIVLTLINVWARHHYTDWIEMAKIQEKMRAFNKFYRKAYQDAITKNNPARLDKLKKLQMKYAGESMKVQSSTMKATSITLIIVIAIFTWLWWFMGSEAKYTYIAVPWNFTVDMNSMFLIFPAWLWIYSIITMPLAWAVQYIFKYFEFRKRLHIEEGE